MINFDVVDFSERRSEEVRFLLMPMRCTSLKQNQNEKWLIYLSCITNVTLIIIH